MVRISIERNKRLAGAERQQLGRQLVREYARGASLATLAQRHQTSAGRVRLILLEQGVVLRPRGGDMRSPRARRRAQR